MAKRLVPSLVFAAFLAYAAASAFPLPPKSAGGFDLNGLRLLPVSVNGRVQPFDSAARMALLRIRGSVTVPVDSPGTGMPRGQELEANGWLLEVLAKPDAADSRRVFPIAEGKLLNLLSLKPAGQTRYYAFRDLAPKVDDIGKQTERIAQMKEADRAPWERELLVLRTRLVAYERIKNSVQPNSLLQVEARGNPVTFEFASELAKYRSDLGEAVRVAERRRAGGKETLDAATEQRVRTFARRFENVARIGVIAVVPPPQPAEAGDRWQTTGAAVVASARSGRLAPPVSYVAEMTSAYARGNAAAFNKTLARYQRWLETNGLVREVKHTGYEAFYNAFQPFVRAVAVYAVAVALLLVASRTRSTMVRRSAAGLVLLAFALHTVALTFTFILAGRPSAITFAGWAIPLAALALALWRRGRGLAAGTAAGLIGILTSYAFVPNGASALLRSVPDVGVVTAIVATAVMLGVAGFAPRIPGWRGVERTAGADSRTVAAR